MQFRFILLLGALFSHAALAKQEKIVLGTFQIPKFVESRSKGEFIKLTQRLSKMSGLKVVIKVLPPRRTIAMFREGKLDGYFPALDTFNQGYETYNSENYYIKKDYLFSKYEENLIHLKNKTICLTTGYPYDKNIIKKYNLKVHFSSSDESCTKMLDRERVDLFMCEAISGIGAMVNTNLLDSLLVSKKFYSKQNVFYSFQKTSKGKMLAKEFSQNIKIIKKSGELKRLFKDAQNLAKDKLDIHYDPLN